MWQFHYTTFWPAVQNFIADQPDNFILHGFLCRITEMDRHFVGRFADAPVHDGGAFVLFLDRTYNFLPFLRIGRSPDKLLVVALRLPLSFDVHPSFFVCICVWFCRFSPKAVPAPGFAAACSLHWCAHILAALPLQGYLFGNVHSVMEDFGKNIPYIAPENRVFDRVHFIKFIICLQFRLLMQLSISTEKEVLIYRLKTRVLAPHFLRNSQIVYNYDSGTKPSI